MYLFNSIPLL